VLRATSIDELPQLWNVLRGDMTLVGPRPCLPSEYELFSEELRQRTSVLPGITGLWQVEARDTESFSAYERLDAFYVENWSASLDVAILLATVSAVLARGLAVVRGLLPWGDVTARTAGVMLE
jgi:lipopolysaccharide/colanic/teichoic acid biosynthesis glycosyltransferase